MSLTNLTPQQREFFNKAKEASNRNNHDYAVKLLKPLCEQLNGILEVRKVLRDCQIKRFNSSSGLAKKSASMKATPAAMKLNNALKKGPQEGIKAAEAVLDIDPFNPQANHTIADAADALKNVDLKIFALETICRGKPDDIESLKNLANTFLADNRCEKAQDTFGAVLKISPTDGEAIKGQKDSAARIASQQGSWEEGGSYRDSLKDEKQAAQLEQQGRVVQDSDSLDEQLAILTQQYNLNNNNVDVVQKMAAVYEKKGDAESLSTAIQWWQWALHLRNGADPVIERKLSTLQLKQLEDSIQQYETAIPSAEGETREQYQTQLDELIAQRAQYRLQNARDQVERYPNDKGLRYDLGVILYEVGEYKEAQTYLQESLRQPNVRHKALNYLGLSFWKRKMLDFAEKQFITAADEIPGMDELKKEITYNLGCVFEDAGKKDQALEQFKTIYEFDSRYKDVADRVEASYQ